MRYLKPSRSAEGKAKCSFRLGRENWLQQRVWGLKIVRHETSGLVPTRLSSRLPHLFQFTPEAVEVGEDNGLSNASIPEFPPNSVDRTLWYRD